MVQIEAMSSEINNYDGAKQSNETVQCQLIIKEQIQCDSVQKNENTTDLITSTNVVGKIIQDTNIPTEKALMGQHIRVTVSTMNDDNISNSSSLNPNQLHSITKITVQDIRSKEQNIFISYSPDAGFVEKQFVQELVAQLKENYMADDIWFDKDELLIGQVKRFAERLEIAEQCKAAILILSDSYFKCPITLHECAAVLDRHFSNSQSVEIYMIKLDSVTNTNFPTNLSQLILEAIDLSSVEHKNKSIAEKISFVVGEMIADLERFCHVRSLPSPPVTPDAELTNEYLKKRIVQWNASDVQDWLVSLGIREFYRQNIAENRIDGFLLLALTESDMLEMLGIDSKTSRKKIMQQITYLLEKECRLDANWHIRAKLNHPRPGFVYIISDISDLRLMQHLKLDLSARGLKVFCNESPYKNSNILNRTNASHMAMASHVIVLLTEAATYSPSIFQETVFANWLDRHLITAVFKNCWANLRTGLRAILGECPAIDFEKRMYGECMDVLLHCVKVSRAVSGIILEQAFVNKMEEALKPLAAISTQNNGGNQLMNRKTPIVFISYHWDMQSKIEQIGMFLENCGIDWCADSSPTIGQYHGSRAQSRLLQRSVQPSSSLAAETGSSMWISKSSSFAKSSPSVHHLQLSLRSASVLLCCMSPKFMQSDSCVHSVLLADSLNKSIIPVLLHFSSWPPDGTPVQLRKLLARLFPIDLSSDKLMKNNLPLLVERILSSLAS